jgi:hypothetical protein
MFEVGFTELPKLAQQIGRWMGRARAMARQFRDQLEEEAHSLETKMSIDPGIDTSLESRKPPAPPAPPASGSPVTPAAEPPTESQPPYRNDVEEEFYPPDHHMHPSNRAHSPPADEPGAQAELDLTTKGDDPPRNP